MQENQRVVLKEYFELITYLNRANKFKNEKTELTFVIRDNMLYATLRPHLEVKAALCAYSNQKRWITLNESRYFYLGNLLRSLLNQISEKNISDRYTEEQLSIALRGFLSHQGVNEP